MLLPRVTQELIDALEEQVLEPQVLPGCDKEQLMYDQGRYDFLQFIKKNAPVGWGYEPQAMMPAALSASCPTCTANMNTTNTSPETPTPTGNTAWYKCLPSPLRSVLFRSADRE